MTRTELRSLNAPSNPFSRVRFHPSMTADQCHEWMDRHGAQMVNDKRGGYVLEERT